jgi:hypothetical protein
MPERLEGGRGQGDSRLPDGRELSYSPDVTSLDFGWESNSRHRFEGVSQYE